MKRLRSEHIPKAVGAYSPASQSGNLILTSGQLPINPLAGQIDQPESIAWQVEQSMKNIQSLLEDNGSSLEDILKVTVFLQSISDFPTFDKVYSGFFKESFPARTAFAVKELPMGAMVEIEAIAEVANGD